MYRTASAGGILDAVLAGAIHTIVVGGARKWQLAEQRELWREFLGLNGGRG
jgi:hypothetical protein